MSPRGGVREGAGRKPKVKGEHVLPSGYRSLSCWCARLTARPNGTPSLALRSSHGISAADHGWALASAVVAILLGADGADPVIASPHSPATEAGWSNPVVTRAL